MRHARLYIPLLIFLLIMGFGYAGFQLNDPKLLPSTLIGKPFPAFTAPLLSDSQQMVSSSQLMGTPVLVNIWATWCPTCKSEHKTLMELATQTGIKIVGINYKDNSALAKDWLSANGDPYDFTIIDLDGSLGIELGVYGAPETFLLDEKGVVVHKHVGDITPEVWRKKFNPILKSLSDFVK